MTKGFTVILRGTHQFFITHLIVAETFHKKCAAAGGCGGITLVNRIHPLGTLMWQIKLQYPKVVLFQSEESAGLTDDVTQRAMQLARLQYFFSGRINSP